MNTSFFRRASALVGAVVICIGLSNRSPDAVSAQAEEAKMAAPQVMLAETYNAVTGVFSRTSPSTRARTNRVSSSDDFGPTLSTGSWTPGITIRVNSALATRP
jgi:hypothetical protein